MECDHKDFQLTNVGLFVTRRITVTMEIFEYCDSFSTNQYSSETRKREIAGNFPFTKCDRRAFVQRTKFRRFEIVRFF